MDKMSRLIETIRTLMDGQFSGYIRINFTQGSLGRIEKSEEFDEAMIMPQGKIYGNRRSEGEPVSHQILKAVPVVALLSFALAGCASSGMVKPESGGAPDPGNVRIVQPGDIADVRYLCRLKSGEIASATGPVAESQPKSSLYLPQESVPLSVAAGSAADEAQAHSAPHEQRTLEDEISFQLAFAVAGMKEGETRTTELRAKDASAAEAHKYIARLNRVRTRPKEWKMPKGDYEFRAERSPEVGQEFTYDPDFPGRVESVSDQEVVVRLFATPGAVIQTPFGPGRVREEDQDYKVDIEARKGALVRAGNMTGRIADVDDTLMIIDFGNPFGGEILVCDVKLEKITTAQAAKTGTGE